MASGKRELVTTSIGCQKLVPSSQSANRELRTEN
jgi:hypothetical protein